MICNVCSREANSQKTIIRAGKLITGCDYCLNSNQAIPHQGNAKFNREWQKKEYRRELTQPIEQEYARAYPEQAREAWGDENFRKLY